MKTDLSFSDFTTGLTDLILPRRCLVCGSALALHERHLCIGCLADLPRTGFSFLSRNQMADRFNSMFQDGDYCFATALFFYRASTGYRRITQSLKYNADFGAGKYFARKLGEEMASSVLYREVDAVLPVPLHWTRRWSRGYNQAEVIARVLADCLGAELRKDILYRAKRTRSQATLSVGEKGTNVLGAFRVHRNRIRDAARYSHILLVDDVFTTGATLYSCYSALRPFTAARISVATLAAVEGSSSGPALPPSSPSPTSSPPSHPPQPSSSGPTSPPLPSGLSLANKWPRNCTQPTPEVLTRVQKEPKLYATGPRRSHLRTNDSENVRNRHLKFSLGNKTGLIRTQTASDKLNNNSNQVIL